MATKLQIWGVAILVLLLLISAILSASVHLLFLAFTALIFIVLVIISVLCCRHKKLRVSDKLQRWGVGLLVVLLLFFILLSVSVHILFLAFAGLIFVVLMVILVCYCRHRKHRGESRVEASVIIELTTTAWLNDTEATGYDGKRVRGLRNFSFTSIASATDDFSNENKLGQGGFGPVFKGKLPEGKEIAVKRLLRNSCQGIQEFKNELKLIGSLQHMNLVRLLGSCVEGDEMMLVYEYMPNKSLDFYIFDQTRRGLLDWKKRYKIIEGVAQGLIYLHKYSRVPIIHRDLKPGNILLDMDMNPKISDFGMARIFDRNISGAKTLRIVGTFGYISPEYAMEGILSEKSDVYSLGVLLLEIVSGRKNNEIFSSEGKQCPSSLVGHAWELWKEGRSTELIDSTLEDQSTRTQIGRCIHVGLLCIQDNAAERPSMSEVIPMVTNETLPLPDPKKPFAAFTRQTLKEIKLESSSGRKQEFCSVNEASVSEMEPR